jgi:uncharacterized protein involved in exopolysaccharide biosynthesis
VSFHRYTLRDLLIEVFYHKKIIFIAFIVPVLLGLGAALMSKPTYVSQARLLVLYGSEYFYRPVTGTASSSVALDRNEIILGELQVLQSTTLAMETLQAVGIDRVYPGTPVGDQGALERAALRFEKDLSLSSIAQSNILELSFRSYDPDVAADVLRALIAGYLERRIAVFAHAPSPTAQTDQATFLDRLHAAEDAFSTFTNEHGIGNFDEQMLLLLRMQSANRQDQDASAQAVSETTAKLAAVQQQIGHVPASVQLYAETDRSRKAEVLNENLAQLQIKRRDLTSRYQPNAPGVQDVDRQIASLQSQLGHEPSHESADVRAGRNPVYEALAGQLVELRAALEGLKAKQAQLAASAAAIAARVREFNDSAQQYRDLLRNRDVLDQTYRAFVRSNEETQIADTAERSRAANIRVVQPPERPVQGRNMGLILIAGGIVVGCMAALAALAVSNALKQVFISVRDASVALDLPVLVAVARPRRRLLPGGARYPDRRGEWGEMPSHGTFGA